MDILFRVQGSSEEPYEVRFLKNEESVAVLCNCPAGERGLHCKHSLALMSGDASNIVSGNEPDLVMACSWLEGTELEKALFDYSEAEREYSEAKKRVTSAKRKLARIMRRIE